MNWKATLFPSLALMTALTTMAQPKEPADALRDFTDRAAKFKSVIRLPQFEITTNEVLASVKQTIAAGNAALDKIGALSPDKVSFDNTVRALDDMSYQVGLTDNRLSLIKETSTNATLRDVATDAI